MTSVELEITAETSYVAYQKKTETEGGTVTNSGSDSSSYYSSSDDEVPEDSPPNQEFIRFDAAVGTRPKRLNPKLLKVVEGVSLALAVAVVLILFSLPIYFYEIERTKNETTTDAPSSSLSPSTGEPAFINSTGSCGALSWGTTHPSSQCSGTPYLDDGVCRDYLHTWRKCILEDPFDGPVMVAVPKSELEDMESEAVQFLQALDDFQQLSTAECNDLAIPSVCLYLFPLCGRDGRVYLPSQELCLEISTVVCQRLWSVAENFGFGDQLPACAGLPVANETQNATIAPSSPVNISCSFGFFLDDGICIPDCYTYVSSPRDLADTNRHIVGAAIGFGLVVSVFVFILSFVRRRVMWKFPYVFLVYVTIDYDILGIFIILSIGDRGLFCSSRNAVDVLSNPSTYCTIVGIVVHYFVINMVYFWFFHVGSTFYKVVFPHLARRYESKQTLIHIGLVLLAVILPLPPVIVVVTNSTYQYTIPDFPPYFCLSTSLNAVVFYSMVLVINLLLAAGVCLFIPIFYVIHKYRLAIRTKKKPKWRISTVGRKILITLCYFMVFGVVSLIYLAVVLAEQEKLLDNQQSYFLCELPGNSSPNSVSNCSYYLEELSDYTALGTTSFTLLGFLPLVFFTFMVDWKRVLKKLNAQCRGCYLRYFHHEEQQLDASTYSPVSASFVN